MKNVFRNSKRGFFANAIVAIVLSVLMVALIMLTGCSAEGVTTTNAYNFQVIEATDDFYVNDFAGLFTAEQKNGMMQKAIQLDENNGGIQVVVTTVKTLNDCLVDGSRGKSIDQISVAMYNQYGIGQDDMGILILFASEDREVKIATGHEMQAYITDGQAGELLDDYGMDYFVNDQFADGLVAVQNAVISKIQTVVPSDWNAGKTEKVKQEEQTRNTAQPATVPVSPVNPSETDAGNVVKSNATQEQKESSNGGAVAVIQCILGALVLVFAGLFGYSRVQLKEEKKKAAQELKSAIDTDKETLQTMLNQAEERKQSAVAEISRTCDERVRQANQNAQKKIETCEARNADLKRQLDAKAKELVQKSQEGCQLTMALDALKEKYSRMQTLHPEIDFEAEIQAMIESEYKARAEALDKELESYTRITPDKDQVSNLYHALELYKHEGHEVWKYLATDIKHLQSLYDESKRLKTDYDREQKELRDKDAAQKIYERVKPVYGEAKRNGASYKNYDDLKNALRIYQNLTQDEKGFFPDNQMITELRSMVILAEHDSNDKSEARKVEYEVESVVNRMSRGDEDDVDKLERLLRRYKSLSCTQKKHFDANLLARLETFLTQARDDHEAQERRRRAERERRARAEREARERRQREEAARRARMSSSSSSFGSSHHSSFGGHGGRASGGGAGRHF